MLPALETSYEGCRFRSRLEARWAVFFDIWGVKWHYEPQGVKLPSGRCYLPDFLIDGIGYVEIKPAHEEDDGKFQELGDALLPWGQYAYCFVGDIPSPAKLTPYGVDWSWVDRFTIIAAHDPGGEYWFTTCPRCDARGCTYQGRYPRLPCRCFQEALNTPDGDRQWNDSLTRLRVAVTAARSARFDGQDIYSHTQGD